MKMKKGKCMREETCKGSAPMSDAHASREVGGNSGKHNMKRPAGWSDRKYTASAMPGE